MASETATTHSSEATSGSAAATSTPDQGSSTAVLDVRGLNWASEQNIVEATLRRRPGVLGVDANAAAQTALVRFDPDRTTIEQLRDWIRECGYHCAGQSVPAHVCDPLSAPYRVLPSTATPSTPSTPSTPEVIAQHRHDRETPGTAHAPDGRTIRESPTDPHPASAVKDAPAPRSAQEVMGHAGHPGQSMAGMARDMRNRFLLAAVFAVPTLLWSPIGRDVFGVNLPVPFGIRVDVWTLLLSLPVVFYADTIFFSGARHALRARTLDMMVLVATAVGAGWLYSFVITLAGGGDVFYEAVTVLSTFVLLGHWFEMRARGGANDAIRTLLNLAPPKAVVLRDGHEVEVSTADVAVGDLLLIRPGSKVAVDGVVEDGETEVDESMVTGESMPVHKQTGSTVIGATLNINGTLRVRASKVGADTALAQIVKLVQEAQSSKAPGQRLADRAAFWLVLVALLGGGLTLTVWLVTGSPLATAMLYAITVVVVTCPDALGLATPTAIMVGTGLGAQRGVLFKNASALETAARIQIVVMDKTGTLTKGEPDVTDVITDGAITEAELLTLAGSVEQESEHPLAKAIVRRAHQHNITPPSAERFENVPGHGAIALVQGRRIAVGSARLMTRERIELGDLAARRDEIAAGGRTAVVVAIDGHAAGVIGVADAIRDTSLAAVAALHDADIQVVMLTGDNLATADRIAAQLGIDTVVAEVLPADKAAKVAELQAGGNTVAMVGDGVNDAPALAQSDLGIAIGAGTDVAIDTADLVLMRSDPLDVAIALRIGRGTVRKERQNLGWAVGYNTIALPIAAGAFEPAFGLVLRPEIAALTMAGSSFIVALNALALKRLHLPVPAAAATTADQPVQSHPLTDLRS